jgi:hypothetical protein
MTKKTRIDAGLEAKIALEAVREPVTVADLAHGAAVMRRIDQLFTAWPFLGSRRRTAMLRAEGLCVNRTRAERLCARSRIRYADGREAARGIADWVAFYDERRPHQALADRAPKVVWREANRRRQGCGNDGRRFRVGYTPKAARADAPARCVIEPSRCVLERNNERPDFQLRNHVKPSGCREMPGLLRCRRRGDNDLL